MRRNVQETTDLVTFTEVITWLSEICLTSLKRYFAISANFPLLFSHPKNIVNFNYNNYYLLIINYYYNNNYKNSQ